MAARKTKKKKSRRRRRSAPAAPMSFADAAEHLLRREGKALKYTRLATVAVEEGLVQTESKTPQISIHVAMRSEIKRRQERGEPQRFVFLGNGLFTLLELVTGAPAPRTKSAVEQVRESRQEACDAVYEKLTSGNYGPQFETMVADLLLSLGYENVEVIGGKDDQGVDITCERREGISLSRVAIQCKCKSIRKQIGPRDISTLRDNLSTYQCQQGILVTTSVLNEEAKAKATEPGKERIHFIEKNELLDLLAEHEIGIRTESLSFFRLDSSQYEFLK